jgi:uncharacterized protein (DUF427 family)
MGIVRALRAHPQAMAPCARVRPPPARISRRLSTRRAHSGVGTPFSKNRSHSGAAVRMSAPALQVQGYFGKMRSEVSPKRVRVYAGGQLVADSRAPVLVWEIPYYPTYYLPAADVLAKLEPAADDTFDVVVGTAVVPGAARLVDDLVRLEFGAMDEWLEEDEPIYVHPRDPYKRVDILASSRHVEVRVDGQLVASSTQPRILFETSLPPRYYLPLSDVRLDLLHPSTTRTSCPYKGTASYWNVGGHEDIVWIYRTPLPESQKIAGLACFYNEKVDIHVDGELQDRPASPFS